MNSKGKLNLYEALQHILSRENVESGSMTQTEEEMPRDNLSERVKEEIAFPELDAKAENITIEAIDIKSEALHE